MRWWWLRRSARRGRGRVTEPDLDAQELTTGWWESPGGDVMLVRYDPVIRRFLLDGTVWPDTGALRAYLRFCERREGWVPLPDEVTERVRGWVGV